MSTCNRGTVDPPRDRWGHCVCELHAAFRHRHATRVGFHHRLVPAANGCIEFQGCRDAKGYGRTWNAGKHIRAHRLAWELAHGPIPDGLQVCHHCDNPPCCNPEHLFLGTNADNMADARAKGRLPDMPRPMGVTHHHAKLNPDTVREIRERGRSYGIKRLAQEYGVSRRAIQGVLNRTTWREVA